MTDTRPQDALRGLEAEASKMLRELDGLTAKLRELGAKGEAASQGAVDQVTAQMKALQEGLARLTADAPKTIAELDRSVRANPYLYILAALGLGWLVGKVMRSSRS